MLLAKAMPSLAEELRLGLARADLERLLAQVDRLHIVGYCNCGDDFCSTLITDSGGEPAKPSYGQDIECKDDGMFIVHLDENENICELEVLFRPDYRQALIELFPDMGRK